MLLVSYDITHAASYVMSPFAGIASQSPHLHACGAVASLAVVNH